RQAGLPHPLRTPRTQDPLMRIRPHTAMACLTLLLAAARPGSAADLVIVEGGRPRAAIFVPARVMDDAKAAPEPPAVWRSLKPEDNRRRLRESVKDLAGILERMSGAKVEVVTGAPRAGD